MVDTQRLIVRQSSWATAVKLAKILGPEIDVKALAHEIEADVFREN